MNLNNIDLNLFIAFDVIYTEGNLTKAGKVLGITQPAVSNALSRLRETFDDDLFVRNYIDTGVYKFLEKKFVLFVNYYIFDFN